MRGTSNFSTWKARVLNIREEHDLDGYISTMVEEPTSNVGHIKFKKNQSKSKLIIYDLVKDNLMSLFTPFKITNECFDSLINLYEKNSPSKNRALKKKIQNLKMEKDETMDSFFTNIYQVRDGDLFSGGRR